VLQRLNTNVFTDPVGVMENIQAVNGHLAGQKSDMQFVNFLPADDGNLYVNGPRGFFRVMDFIDGVSYDEKPTCEILEKAAFAFGAFQKSLAAFPAARLHETIKQFHDTVKRVNDLHAAIAADKAGRRSAVSDVVDGYAALEKYASVIVDGLKDGSVPMRVTHNDTKLNNLLFDKKSGEPLAVIDLDTIMPGSLLYDFGDALRFGGSSAAEDEKDLSAVYFCADRFEAFARGFIRALGADMTVREKELLPLSVLLMTFECGTRFLADYLNGDTYFRIAYPTHNLDRARNQLKLAQDIEAQLPALSAIVAKL